LKNDPYEVKYDRNQKIYEDEFNVVLIEIAQKDDGEDCNIDESIVEVVFMEHDDQLKYEKNDSKNEG
jgi:hypothetical protein